MTSSKTTTAKRGSHAHRSTGTKTTASEPRPDEPPVAIEPVPRKIPEPRGNLRAREAAFKRRRQVTPQK